MFDRCRITAVIPARSRSKRIPSKNIKKFFGHPLIAYTIEAAKQSGIFDRICVSTDHPLIGHVANHYGARAYLRPEKYGRDKSPDIQWLKNMKRQIWDPRVMVFKWGMENEYFCILRPTNPFRTPESIYYAWHSYERGTWLKAIEPCKQHPYKMFVATENNGIVPFDEDWNQDKLHALPTQTFPPVFAQNGSLEIRPIEDLEPERLTGFITKGYEGFDINTWDDWKQAFLLVASGEVELPKIKIKSVCEGLPSVWWDSQIQRTSHV